MMKQNILASLKKNWIGIAVALFLGVVGYEIHALTKAPIADPLLVALIIGILVRTAMGDRSRLTGGFAAAPSLFIPIGIIFYATKNLNFVKFAKIEPGLMVLLGVIMLAYFAVILGFGKLLRQKEEITYLTATGSAVCGASAIAATCPAVKADPDDVSISLIAVTVAAFFGLIIVLPFVAILFDMTSRGYGLLSGSVLQFTGFVKAAVSVVPFLTEDIPACELTSLALSVKAVRYLGLLVAIPLFASLIRRKLYIPWFLWIFLGAGLVGSWVCKNFEAFYTATLIPFVKPIYVILWASAMAAIGLNANAKKLMSNNGAKALLMAFAGFIVAIATFFIGIALFNLV